MASKIFYFINTSLIMKYLILKPILFSDSLLDANKSFTIKNEKPASTINIAHTF